MFSIQAKDTKTRLFGESVSGVGVTRANVSHTAYCKLYKNKTKKKTILSKLWADL